MEVSATAKYIRVSPRKLRTVADALRGMPVVLALNQMPFIIKSAVVPLSKAVKSAVANATNNLKLDINTLKIKNILINEGVRMKRQDKSRSAKAGRGIIQKRTSNILVTISDNGKES